MQNKVTRNTPRRPRLLPPTKTEALSPIGKLYLGAGKRLNALDRGRQKTADLKKRRSMIRKKSLHEIAKRLSLAGLSLKKMTPVLAQLVGLSVGRTRKLLYNSLIVPENLCHIRDVAIAFYLADWSEVNRVCNYLTVAEGKKIKAIASELKSLPEAERQRIVLTKYFGFAK